MSEKLALKRLAGSDISFFDFHFRNQTYGDHRQKGINLNTDIFVDRLYPLAHMLLGTKWPVLTTIYGPGFVPAYAPGDHYRPITYNNDKNWRLNGGTIPDDPALPDRFKPIAPGDLVLFRFRGSPSPLEVDVILISRNLPEDGFLHAKLDTLLPTGGRRTMVQVTAEQIGELLAGPSLSDHHPLSGIILPLEEEEAIEDVALGGPETPVLRRRRGGRRFTPCELIDARDAASKIGMDGEGLLHAWLVDQSAKGQFRDLDWTSQRDAAAPYDFSFKNAGGRQIKIAAKSTNGPFARKIHISFAELSEASRGPERYDIARLYSIDADGARMKIAENIRALAPTIFDSLRVPAGVGIDSFSLDPNVLTWSDEIIIRRSAEQEG